MIYQNESRSVTPEVINAWATLQDYALLRPIRNDADFELVQAVADNLADEVGDDESHSLFALFELAMFLIEKWEDEHVEIPDTEPKEVLRFLLDEHDLKQKDLADIASPTLISDILAGRRQISRVLAKNLAQRFHVDASAFL
jgi:HTH-type transcriptional regulator/antitoxin HigA